MINLKSFTKNIFFALIFLFVSGGIFVSAQAVEITEEPEVSVSDEISEDEDLSAQNSSVSSGVSEDSADFSEKTTTAENSESFLPDETAASENSLASENAKNPESTENQPEIDEYGDDIASIQVEIPAEMRPKKADPEKLKEVQQKDEDGSEFETNSMTLSFGTPSEINSVVDKIVEEDDPRYSDALYDLFQSTASNDVRKKILGYFARQKDPCLSSYAVEIIDDPYDTPLSLVQECMTYVSEVKCKAAAPALVKLIDADEEKYFTAALSALGKTGGPKESLYLSKFLERDDLETARRQALMRTLGQMNAVETFDSVMKIAQDEDENSFVRMYAAEALGNMKKDEAIPVLIKLFETDDPNMREYCIKGLQNFPDSKKAKTTIVQAIRDDHVKVRIQAVKAVKEMQMKDAMDFLIYRAKNDSENSVKKECYPVIAEFDTQKGNDFLVKQITDKKVPDSAKLMAAEALLKSGNNAGTNEIAELAKKIADDPARKSLKYSLGKVMSKYMKPAFAEVAVIFVQSKDAQLAALGLDMYKAGRYETVKSAVKTLAEDKKNSANRKRARKLLGMEDEDFEKKDTDSKTEEIKSPAKNSERENSSADAK